VRGSKIGIRFDDFVRAFSFSYPHSYPTSQRTLARLRELILECGFFVVFEYAPRPPFFFSQPPTINLMLEAIIIFPSFILECGFFVVFEYAPTSSLLFFSAPDYQLDVGSYYFFPFFCHLPEIVNQINFVMRQRIRFYVLTTNQIINSHFKPISYLADVFIVWSPHPTFPVRKCTSWEPQVFLHFEVCYPFFFHQSKNSLQCSIHDVFLRPLTIRYLTNIISYVMRGLRTAHCKPSPNNFLASSECPWWALDLSILRCLSYLLARIYMRIVYTDVSVLRRYGRFVQFTPHSAMAASSSNPKSKGAPVSIPVYLLCP